MGRRSEPQGRWWRGVLAALPLAVMCATVGTAVAAEVYRWTDSKGVVHFSDKPPAGSGVTHLQPIALPGSGPRIVDPRDEYFSVVNQARRMTAERLEQEKAWRERLEAEAQLQRERNAAEWEQAATQPAPPLEPYVVTQPFVHPWPWPYNRFSRHPGGHPVYSPYWPLPPGPHSAYSGPKPGPSAPRSRLKPGP